MWMYCNVLHQPYNVHCRPSIAISSIVVSISRWHVYLHWIQEMWFHFTSKVGTELPPCTWQCVEITGRKRPTRSNVLDLVVLIIYTSIPFTKGIGDSTQLRDLTCCMPSWFKNVSCLILQWIPLKILCQWSAHHLRISKVWIHSLHSTILLWISSFKTNSLNSDNIKMLGLWDRDSIDMYFLKSWELTDCQRVWKWRFSFSWKDQIGPSSWKIKIVDHYST